MEIPAASTLNFGFRQGKIVSHCEEMGMDIKRSAKTNRRLAVLA